MIHGCVPVARYKGMGDEVFLPGHHYVEIPESAGPQTYADVILEAGNMSTAEAKVYHDNARALLPMFDRKRVAQQVIDLAHGDAPIEPIQGTASQAMKSKVEDICFNHFGVLI